MSEMVEFLQARFDEDEALARRGWSSTTVIEETEFGPTYGHGYPPDRVLADVAVKREILRLHGRMAIEPTHPQFNDAHLTKESMVICRSCEPETMWRRTRSWPCRTLRALAVPYAGHVDYRQEWAQ